MVSSHCILFVILHSACFCVLETRCTAAPSQYHQSESLSLQSDMVGAVLHLFHFTVAQMTVGPSLQSICLMLGRYHEESSYHRHMSTLSSTVRCTCILPCCLARQENFDMTGIHLLGSTVQCYM